ncbi:hypothetical protein AB0873_05175 [Micromonospora sp. NPDC047707]|uniref:hypothetical protein n=1 Tax=unclassified Micromonospora TaxID=2617518 RepID=UPI0012B501FE|nr:hypothetical protein [Micromonospora sp. WMMC415]QGN50506.1 hypothetical protein GKC29_29225 [Micromonospora sp. WMMC415]
MEPPLDRPVFETPTFTSGLRGYDKRRVDELIGRCVDALNSDQASRIEQAKTELDRERGKLPLALRGYDRGQVDGMLERLSAVLGHLLPDS